MGDVFFYSSWTIAKTTNESYMLAFCVGEPTNYCWRKDWRNGYWIKKFNSGEQLSFLLVLLFSPLLLHKKGELELNGYTVALA